MNNASILYSYENLINLFAIFYKNKVNFEFLGTLAQLVQSIALTGQGSLVRIQYVPHLNWHLNFRLYFIPRFYLPFGFACTK